LMYDREEQHKSTSTTTSLFV